MIQDSCYFTNSTNGSCVFLLPNSPPTLRARFSLLYLSDSSVPHDCVLPRGNRGFSKEKNTGFQLDELFSNNSSYTFWLAFKEYTRNISVAVGMYLVQNTALNWIFLVTWKLKAWAPLLGAARANGLLPLPQDSSVCFSGLLFPMSGCHGEIRIPGFCF